MCEEPRLPQTELWVVRLSQCASIVTQALNIRRLSEMIQGTTTLSISPVWMLGAWYGKEGSNGESSVLTPEVLTSLREDFGSRIWCTYRRNFPLLGEGGFSSDVGWGCTLRSGQMLVAETLSRQLLGRSWRRGHSPDQLIPSLDTLCSLLALLQDGDSTAAPLSVHSICSAGKDYGVLPGRWLGPWTLCKSLGAAISKSRPAGLQVHVVCDPAGCAPTLDVNRVRQQVFGVQGAAATLQPLQAGFVHEQCQQSMHQPAAHQLLHAGQGAWGPVAEEQPAGACIVQPGIVAGSKAPGAAMSEHGHKASYSSVVQSKDSPTHLREPVASCCQSGISVPMAEQPCQHECLHGVAGAEAQQPEGSSLGHFAMVTNCDLDHRGSTGNSNTHLQGPAAGQQLEAGVHVPQGDATADCACSCTVAPGNVASDVNLEQGSQAVAAGATGSCGAPGSQEATSQQLDAMAGPLLLLIPLTLGVGKVNPLYFPQLKQALTFPQSVGIVGGRPGASLFFIGHQDENLLYLDPHETQPCGPLPAAAASYFCSTMRLMPMTSMDPSLAIGFHCATLGDFDELCQRLRQLCADFPSAPLLTVSLDSSPACLDQYQDMEDALCDRVEALESSSDGEEAGGNQQEQQAGEKLPAAVSAGQAVGESSGALLPDCAAAAAAAVSGGNGVAPRRRDDWEVL